MPNPALDQLQEELRLRQTIEVRAHDRAWARYFADRAGWIGSPSLEIPRDLQPDPVRPVVDQRDRAISFLERASQQKNAGAILVMVRSALAALKGAGGEP